MYSGQVVPVRVAKLTVISRGAGVWAGAAKKTLSSAKLAGIVFTGNMRDILVIFIADVFEQLSIHLERGVPVQGERPGIGSGIGDGGFKLQMTDIGAAVALHHAQLLGVRMAREIEPEFI